MKRHEDADLLARIGERIESARKEKGWTQSVLGKQMGRTKRGIIRWEAGAVELTVSDLSALAVVLHDAPSFAPIVRWIGKCRDASPKVRSASGAETSDPANSDTRCHLKYAPTAT